VWISLCNCGYARPDVTGPTGAGIGPRPELTWTAVTGAAGYDLWVDNLTTGQRQVIRELNLTATSYTPSFDLTAGTYRVWVRAIAANGPASAWSERFDFDVAGTGEFRTDSSEDESEGDRMTARIDELDAVLAEWPWKRPTTEG